MLKTFLKDHYNLEVSKIKPLAIGADPNAAVYQVDSAYFLKLHHGNFNHITLQVPHFLQKHGVERVVAPIPTQSGELYTQYENAIAILYPFIEGKDGFTVNLSAQNWVDLGETLRQIHGLTIPNLRQETYTPYWRDIVKSYQAKSDDNPIANLIRTKREEIDYLIQQAERFAAHLITNPLEFVLCHADIHVGNVLITEQDQLFIVDWDDTILAPKERDLMFIGAGIGELWEHEEHFWDGYGEVEINPIALAYYRHERIIQDIAVTILEYIETDVPDLDALIWMINAQFTPNGVLDMARKSAEGIV